MRRLTTTDKKTRRPRSAMTGDPTGTLAGDGPDGKHEPAGDDPDTREEAERLLTAGKPIGEIARRLRLPEDTIEIWARALFSAVSPVSVLKERARGLLHDGHSQVEVAQQLKVSQVLVDFFTRPPVLSPEAVSPPGPPPPSPSPPRPRVNHSAHSKRELGEKMLKSGASDIDVRRALSVSPTTVSNWRQKFGIPSPPGRNSKKAEAEALLREGRKVTAVARALGLSLATVNTWRRQMGLVMCPVRKHRQRMAEILLRAGYSDQQVARQIHMHVDVVARLRTALGLVPGPAGQPGDARSW
jgi:DNA-binding CsgD family transcriptional regulator